MVKQNLRLICRKVQISRERKLTRLQTINRTSIIRDQKGMTKVLSLKVENELLDKGSVEITKVDKESGAVLAGVTFEVQDEKAK